MKITVVGTGYVGLVSGVCFAEFGFDVTCVDKDQDKVSCLRNGEPTIFEPGLKKLMLKNMQAGRLVFTDDIAEAVKHTDVIFIAVGTPSQPDGSANLSYVFSSVSCNAPLRITRLVR